MKDNKLFDEVTQRFSEALPGGARLLRDDIEQAARSVLQQVLRRMDVVTREEFDVQAELLSRTRIACDRLEQRVAVLENKKIAQ